MVIKRRHRHTHNNNNNMPPPPNRSLEFRYEMAKDRRKKAERDAREAQDALMASELEEAELQKEYTKFCENERQGSNDEDDDDKEEAQHEPAASRSRPSVVAIVKAAVDEGADRRKKARVMGQSMLECNLMDFLNK